MFTVADVYKECVEAIRRGELIMRQGAKDKEFHFQNWFQKRLQSLKINFDEPGRNTYPDFRLVNQPVGFEIKGLAYPGRNADYDANSQVPSGEHHGRAIYYVFGRYPKEPDGDSYPVYDLVVCHGNFLNADSDYVHKNKSFRGFGTYGDILVRDRKMYVVPTPFALAQGTAHRRTLILPETEHPGDGFVEVGRLVRKEVAEVVVAYEFDLRDNSLRTKLAANANAGREHLFVAYRLAGDPIEAVELASRSQVLQMMMTEADMDGDENN